MSSLEAFEIGRLFLPIKTIADTLTAAQSDLFIRLPGLQGYWPTSIRTNGGNVVDHSDGSYDLMEVGSCQTGYDGNAFAHLGNGINYLSGTLVGGIEGTEAWIESAIRGLTIGCWVNVDETPSIYSGVMSKDGLATNRGYGLWWQQSNAPAFFVSGDGTTTDFVTAPPSSIAQWVFLVGRFIPSTEVAVFVNGVKTSNSTSIPASINVSTGSFEVGRYLGVNSRILHCRVRDVFICAAALTDAQIVQIMNSSQ